MKLQLSIAEKYFASTDTIALEALELDCASGEFVALSGTSGSGKSTCLQILAGLDTDYTGEVLLDGTPPRAGRDDVSYVFQSPRLMPWLSARDNVTLVLDEHDADAPVRADEMLQRMGLAGFEDAYPAQLSGGMQRRVALARAFVRTPRLLLLDEPFASLDADTAERLRALLLDLWESSGATCLFVTHDLEEALTMADRVVMFTHSPGRIAASFPIGEPRPRDPLDPALTAIRAQLRPLLSRPSSDAPSPTPEGVIAR